MRKGKMEVIVITADLAGGGVERVIAELVSEWCKTIHVTLVMFNWNNIPDAYPVSDLVERVEIGIMDKNRLLRYIKGGFSLAGIIRKHPNAVVVALLPSLFYSTNLAAMLTNTKAVLAERNDPSRFPKKKLNRKLRDLMIAMSDVCVFQTEEAMGYFSKRIQMKGVIIPNPIDPSLPERYPGTKRKVAVAACRLDDQKNIPMMIDAFAGFHEDFPDYILEIYGRGEDEEKLKEYVAANGLQDCVFMKGFTPNIHEIMNTSAMYLSSSDYEGISNSMLEALALGLPCVCTDCPVGGARLAIQDGKNGRLVPVGDSKAMCEAMKQIAGDQEFAKRLADNAYKIRERFSIDEIAGRWLEAIKKAYNS